MQGVRGLQGDPSDCSLGFVDINTKVAFYFMDLTLKMYVMFMMSTIPKKESDGSPNIQGTAVDIETRYLTL